MGFMSGEELVLTLAPVVVYWVYAGVYEALLEHTTVLDRYRLHSRRDEETKNIASRKDVVRGVLLQQAIQAAISVAVLKVSRAQLFLFIVIVYARMSYPWLISALKSLKALIELTRNRHRCMLFFPCVCVHGFDSLKKTACVFLRK